MSQPIWERPPNISPNLGRSKLTHTGVPRSREIDVILRENVGEARQLATLVSALTLENSRVIRLMNTSRKKFIARQIAKQKELERLGLSNVYLLPPNAASALSSSVEDNSRPTTGREKQEKTTFPQLTTPSRGKYDDDVYVTNRSYSTRIRRSAWASSGKQRENAGTDDVFYEPEQPRRPKRSGDVTKTRSDVNNRSGNNSNAYGFYTRRDSELVPLNKDPRFVALMESLSRPTCAVLPNEERFWTSRTARGSTGGVTAAGLQRRRSTQSRSRKSTAKATRSARRNTNNSASTAGRASCMTDRSKELTIVEKPNLK